MEERRSQPRLAEARGEPRAEPIYRDDVAVVSRSSVSWGSIFAGVLSAILVYMILMSLGLAIGGTALGSVVTGEASWEPLGIGTAIWLIVAALVSLFIGAYVAGRVSGLITTQASRAQGLVIAALFFLVMALQAGGALADVGRGVGSVVGAAGGAAANVAENPEVRQTIEQALGDLDLRSPPDEVAQGIAVRLLRGDPAAARRYLANQAGIPESEAQARIQQARGSFETALEDAGAAAGQVAQAAGWTLFAVFLLGTLSAMFGGHLGARPTSAKPAERGEDEQLRERAA